MDCLKQKPKHLNEKNYLCQWKCHINIVKGANYSFLVGPLTAEVRGGGILGLVFAGYVPLASQNPYPILAKSN